MNSSIRVPSKGGTLFAQTVPSRVERFDRWFGRVPASVLLDESLSLAAIRIYGLLALSVFEGRVASVGTRQLGRLIGKSQQTAMRHINELIAAGHLKRRATEDGRRGKYELTSPIFGQKQGKANVIVSAPRGGRRLVSVKEVA